MNTETSTLDPEEAELERSLQDGSHKSRTMSRRWLWLLVISVLGVSVWLVVRWQTQSAASAKQSKEAVPPGVPVNVVPAKKGDIPLYLNGLGSVTSFNTVTVRSRIDGQLVQVAFQEGQFVKQGELLAQIDSRPFEVQLTQAQGQLARDQAQLGNANLDLQRYKTLAADGVITQQQADTQAATVRQFEGVITADQAGIDNARLQISYCRIAAPISGRIGLRLVDVGNMIHAADPNGLVVITQVEPIAVLFTIPEDSLSEVLKKLRAGEHLPVEAYDRSGQTRIAAGRLETVDNQIDPTTGTTRLKAVFDNKDNTLFPNQFVNVRLLVESKKDRILIPAVAIQRGPQGTFVYVVKEDQTADVRPIQAGTIEGNEASIESGISEGELVVVDGVDKLRAGSKVRLGVGAE
ncbi:MAG TPA: MdtA/MuxA family multidrug efflux RND transporter periplasmic adaptor subunit [Blastocatellia bacterium]|nr:MdtA/MuxA family multidrug efflux RND transporter periplasmic adaptor subunit [Blastocatellia bacterium]